MANYNFKGQAPAIPYDAVGFVQLRKTINIPELIANQTKGQELVDDDGNTLSLPATGFSDGDFLRVFNVPEGFVALGAGINVLTAEGGVATVDLGDGDNQAGYMNDTDINAVAHNLMVVGAAYGPDNLTGKDYEADDTIDIEFNTDLTAVAVLDVWVFGVLASPQSALEA